MNSSQSLIAHRTNCEPDSPAIALFSAPNSRRMMEVEEMDMKDGCGSGLEGVSNVACTALVNHLESQLLSSHLCNMINQACQSSILQPCFWSRQASRHLRGKVTVNNLTDKEQPVCSGCKHTVFGFVRCHCLSACPQKMTCKNHQNSKVISQYCQNFHKTWTNTSLHNGEQIAAQACIGKKHTPMFSLVGLLIIKLKAISRGTRPICHSKTRAKAEPSHAQIRQEAKSWRRQAFWQHGATTDCTIQDSGQSSSCKQEALHKRSLEACCWDKLSPG